MALVIEESSIVPNAIRVRVRVRFGGVGVRVGVRVRRESSSSRSLESPNLRLVVPHWRLWEQHRKSRS